MNSFLGVIAGAFLLHGWPGLPVRAITPFPNGIAAALISGFTATPSTIMFTATDPDLGSVTNSSVRITWSALVGLPINTWNLKVQAGAGGFTGCSTVPISAVTVSCSSAAATGLGGSGTCSGPFTLSTSPQQIASGAEGTAAGNYTVTLALTLADSWRYIAALAPTCSLSITYTATTP